jgi:hypothetical protein
MNQPPAEFQHLVSDIEKNSCHEPWCWMCSHKRMERIWEYQRTYGAVLDQIDPDQWADWLLSNYRSLEV